MYGSVWPQTGQSDHVEPYSPEKVPAMGMEASEPDDESVEEGSLTNYVFFYPVWVSEKINQTPEFKLSGWSFMKPTLLT